MALLWFILGVLLICCIARYNESNKLFWTLFASFVGFYAAASIAIACCNSEPNKEDLTQVCPTQLYTNTSSVQLLADDVCFTTYDVQCTSVAAGKDYIPEPSKIAFISEVNNQLFDKPPQKPRLCYSTSTHLDVYQEHPIRNSS